jgi:trk system potassium uptake protein TrkH
MLVRPRRSDLRVIGYYLGRVFLLVAGFASLPLCWAVLAREWAPASSFVLMVGVFVLLGVLATAWPPVERRLEWSHGMVVAALAWIVVPVVGSIPLALSGHFADPLDAYFDAVSGVTTTGLSLLQDLDHLAPSLAFWRHLLQLMGGQGIIIAGIALFAGGAGLTTSFGDTREQRILPSVASTTRFVWRTSLVHLVLGVAALASAAYFTLGFSLHRSVFHGLMVFLSAFNTSGFAPQSTNLGYYHSAVFEVVVAVLMISGAMSFGLHFALWRGPRRLHAGRNLETRTSVVSFVLVTLATFAGLAALGIYRGVPALARQGIFQVLSAHTTSGLSTVLPAELGLWGGLAFAGMGVAMGLGGMASSTAGGVKSLRVGLAVKSLSGQVKEMLFPEHTVISSAYYQGGRKRLTAQVAQAVLVISLLYVGLYLLGAAIGMAYGYPLQLALFESVSAGSTTGLSAGITHPTMPVVLQVTYMVEMVLGRLEFVSIFALLGLLWAGVRGR